MKKILTIIILAMLTIFISIALAIDDKVLVKLKGMGEEYKDFKLSEAKVAPSDVSVITKGGLKFFTKYASGRVAAVRISEEDQKRAETLFADYVTSAITLKKDSASDWQLLVVCNESTGAKMGGGAIWKGIPRANNDAGLNDVGVNLGYGGNVTPLVTGSFLVVNRKDKLLVFYKEVYATGWDLDSVMRGFGVEVAKEFASWTNSLSK